MRQRVNVPGGLSNNRRKLLLKHVNRPDITDTVAPKDNIQVILLDS